MSILALSLLGSLQVTINGQPVSGFESARVRALLAYLAVEGDLPQSRDSLAGLFWPESSDQTARKNLRQALSNLRKVIADHKAEPPYLQVTRESVQFTQNSKHWLDVVEFSALISAVDSHRHRRLESCQYCAKKLQQAVDLYKGEFLQGFFLDDSVAFQDWMLLKRERFHRQVVQSLTVLTQFYEQRGNFDLARRYAYLQVEFDPWREAGHQHLMFLLTLEGERGAALKQYETCRDILDAELGVAPSPDTTQLYEQIKANKLTVSQGPPHQNMPSQTTSFVGRESELGDLLALLSDSENRLVTLIGPGGIGKTRLALQAASDTSYDFRDGVCFVPLVSVDSGDDFPTTIAAALELTFQGRERPIDQLINFLRSKELLLVLDNFEHLLDDLDLVMQIIRQAPGVFLLVSSREPLGLQAEQLLELGGLSFSEVDISPNAGICDALILFQERAQRLRPKFTLDESNLRYVANICRIVEGSPLAIELAASLVRQWTCAEIEAEIKHSLDALATSMSDLPERHRSMRATFERSWQLLSPQEQDVFQKLAIFRGGFTVDAASEIAQVGKIELATLMDKSLLRRDTAGRYSLHPLIMQYLREKLSQDSHIESTTLEKMSAYFSGVLQEAESKLKSNHQPEFLDAISQDLENIQIAWRWSLQNKRFDLLNHSLEALYVFFEGRSRYQEGASLFQSSLDAFEDSRAGIFWRVRARYGALLYRLGDYDKAQELFNRCLEAFQRLEDRKESAFTLYANGNLAYLRGDFEAAIQHYQQSLDISEQDGMTYEMSQALNGMGLAVYMLGDYSRAQYIFNESLAIHQEIGDPWGQAIRNNNMALVLHAQGQYAEAKDFYARSLNLWKRIRQEYGMASCYNNMGLVSEALGDYYEARHLYTDALKRFEQLGHRYGIASCKNNLGNVAVALDEYGQAQNLFRGTLEIREALGDRRGIASVLNNLGNVTYLLEESEKAKGNYLRALDVGWENKAVPVVLDSLLGLAKMLVDDGSHPGVVKLLSFVINHSSSNRETKDRALNLLEKARAEYQGDDFENLLLQGNQKSLDHFVSEFLSEVK